MKSKKIDIAKRQLKTKIECFSHEDKNYEDGVVRGLFYAIMLLEHGKQYADRKVDFRTDAERG